MELDTYTKDFDNIYKWYNWPAVQGAGYNCLANINLMAPKNVTGTSSVLLVGSTLLVSTLVILF